jgi:hypothetical protein
VFLFLIKEKLPFLITGTNMFFIILSFSYFSQTYN